MPLVYHSTILDHPRLRANHPRRPIHPRSDAKCLLRLRATRPILRSISNPSRASHWRRLSRTSSREQPDFLYDFCQERTTNFASLFKRRQIRGSEPCAIATAHILLQVVARSKWQDVDGLIDAVSSAGRRLVDAQPKELVIGNIVRRVLALIRDEAAEDRNEAQSESQSEAPTPTTTSPPSQPWPTVTPSKPTAPIDQFSSPAPATPIRPSLIHSHSTLASSNSLLHLLSATPQSTLDGMSSPNRNSGTSTPVRAGGHGSSHLHALRSEVIEGIEEIKDEISQVDDLIAGFAEVQINPGDHVLVHQPSPTVERFVLRAASKRKFTVLLVTAASREQPNEVQYATLRKKLSTAGVHVINVMNAGLMAYKSRINKVIFGARAIVADGGAVTDAGAGAIARAAKEQGTAVVVLAGVYRLSPADSFSEDSLIEWGDPSSVVSFAEGGMVNDVEIRNAVTELVPASYIDTYITNL